MKRIGHGLRAAVVLMAILGTASSRLAAQAPAQAPAHPDTADQAVKRVKREREGAGLRVGSWMVSNLATPSGASSSTLPAIEGYWQKGLDRHLVIETSAGLWHRQQSSGSGPSAESVGSFVVPMFTSLKLFPFTGPEDKLEPLLTAGAGFVLGLDKQNTVSGGLLGGGGGSSSLNIVAGVGVKGGAGFEWRFSEAFGLNALAGYQYIVFAQDVGGQGSYKGLVLYAGLTYRFQY